MLVAKHINNLSNEERLFQVYKEIAICAVTEQRKITGAFYNTENTCQNAMDEAKIIMKVFNERNLNEQTENKI